jgi:hypothetical protein
VGWAVTAPWLFFWALFIFAEGGLWRVLWVRYQRVKRENANIRRLARVQMGFTFPIGSTESVLAIVDSLRPAGVTLEEFVDALHREAHRGKLDPCARP